MLDKKSLTWFLLIAFGISWPLFIAPMAVKNNPMLYPIVMVTLFTLAMWGPGIAAILVTRLVVKKPLSSLQLNRLGPRHYYFWAWLFALLMAALTLGATILLGTGVFDPNFTSIRQAMAQTPQAEGLPSIETILMIQAIFALTLAPLINILPALGEELGWRGFLLPQLLPLGQWKALLLSGAIWGLWHAPAITLHGHNFPSHPYLGVLVMTVGCILLGALFGWLYLKTQSPWAPALAHGAFNAIAPTSLVFLRTEGLDTVLGGNPLGVAGWVGMAAILLVLLVLRQFDESTLSTPTQSPGA